jgi:hypothetical protein
MFEARWIFAAAVGLCALTAQETGVPQLPEIRGVVVEPGTNLPVANAVVSLYFLGAEAPKIIVGTGLLDVTGTVNTDATGAFSALLDKVAYYRTPRSSGAVISTFSSVTTNGTDAISRSSAFRPFTTRISLDAAIANRCAGCHPNAT